MRQSCFLAVGPGPPGKNSWIRAWRRPLSNATENCFWPGTMGPPGVWGIGGEWLFIFRELGSTGNYFKGFGEQAHSFGDLESPAKK